MGAFRELRVWQEAKALAELQTQLEIAQEIGYLTPSILSTLDEKCRTLGKMPGSLIKARSTPCPITHEPSAMSHMIQEQVR